MTKVWNLDLWLGADNGKGVSGVLQAAEPAEAVHLLQEIAQVEKGTVVLRVQLQCSLVVQLRFGRVLCQRPEVVQRTRVAWVQPGKSKC